MTEQTENKVEALPDLDDLLQCPVCYEIPSGQIFQCNEGHHVCGRCKMRLDVCPVCRAFFFGTRNYAMEELIANVKKLQAFKLGGKVTTGTPPAEATPDVAESSSDENETSNENINEEDDASSRTSTRPPTACKGLFRCLCCKNNPERLPLARLLNHLRYYHSPDLIEGRSENGGYLQAWQFPTAPGRLVTAVRVHDMGIFFLVIELTHDSVHAWMSMAASPWVAHEFSYSFTLSGNDREAIFSDCVWSVRSCEGSLKRRGRCLSVRGADARALLAPAAMSGKLSVRRTPNELQPASAQPRAVLRVANRSAAPPDHAHDLEPFLQDLQNDVARLSRAFATLGREADALVRSEAEMRARLEPAPAPTAAPAPAAAPAPPPLENGERQMSRSARRRMRQRLREAFRENQAPERAPAAGPAAAARPDPAHALRAAPAPAARPATVPAPPARAQVVLPPHLAAAARPDPAHALRATPASAARPATVPAPPARVQVVPPPQLVAWHGRASLVSMPRPVPDHVRQNIASIGVYGIAPARVPSGDARGNVRAPMSAGAARVSGPAGNPGAARAASEPVVHHIDYLRAVSPPAVPPPVPPPSFGGPSQDRPANGNARNKKKRRQRR